MLQAILGLAGILIDYLGDQYRFVVLKLDLWVCPLVLFISAMFWLMQDVYLRVPVSVPEQFKTLSSVSNLVKRGCHKQSPSRAQIAEYNLLGWGISSANIMCHFSTTTSN